MKVEAIKGVSHSIELIHGETSVCITPGEAENLIAQLRAVVPVAAGFREAAENSEIIFSTDGELTIYSFVGAPRWWATIREAEEALSVFKAGAEWQRNKPIPEDVQDAAKAYEDSLDYHECMSQWPSVGFAAGMIAERERLTKEAVEIEIGWSDGYRIAPADENSMNEALAKIGVLDQVGAGVDAKVSVVIIKKEK